MTKCLHNNIENNCFLCNQIKKVNSQSKQVCKHWIPLNENCYVCKREKEREKLFNNSNVNGNINTTPSNGTNNQFGGEIKTNPNFFNDQILQTSDYMNPENSQKKYPTTSNRDSNNANNANNASSLRKDDKNGKVNSFMQRSLDTFGFIENNNSKNIWSNPIANNSFPSAHISNNESNESNYLGVSTRGNRKLGNTESNTDFHLKRSMLQPDFRSGNRFFEYKPTNTRRDSYKDLGNENARKFQNQTEQLFNEMDHTKAYDQAAGINRG